MRRTTEGYRVLGLRCYKNWDFPKGKLEPGEEPLQAALREAEEEAALTDLRLSWGQGSRDTAPYGKGKVATYFLGETEREEIVLPINPELGHAEHHEGRWLSFAGAAEIFPARLQDVLAWARELVEGSE